MTLTMTVFYDIPQLNLGLQLHSYADIRPKIVADNHHHDKNGGNRVAATSAGNESK